MPTPGISIRFQGLDEAVARLRAAGDKLELQALARLLTKRGEAIMRVSKRQVPVDTGALRNSGRVGPPIIEGNSVSVSLYYGGPSAPYAFLVHENLRAEHKVGGAKYLENAVLAERDGLLKELAEEIRDTIRSRRAERL